MVTGQASDTVTIADGVTLTLSGDILSRPVRAELRPDRALCEPPRATPTSRRWPGWTPRPRRPRLGWPSGDAGSTRLDVTAAHALLSLDGTLDGEFELVIEAGLDAAVLVVDLSGSDGFVVRTVGSQPIRTPVSLVLHWSSRTGLSLRGPAHLSDLRSGEPLDRAGLGVGNRSRAGQRGGGSATFDATVDRGGHARPLHRHRGRDRAARPDRPSVRTARRPATWAGPTQGSASSRRPGAGLVCTPSGLSGGGFIGRDPASGRYSGVLNLRAGQIDITALGLLDTKLPGAQRDYALLVALGATFPAIEIGFGFALTSVGGLLALNRRWTLTRCGPAGGRDGRPDPRPRGPGPQRARVAGRPGDRLPGDARGHRGRARPCS